MIAPWSIDIASGGAFAAEIRLPTDTTAIKGFLVSQDVTAGKMGWSLNGDDIWPGTIMPKGVHVPADVPMPPVNGAGHRILYWSGSCASATFALVLLLERPAPFAPCP